MKLLNCPFCGSNSISKRYREEDTNSRYCHEIHYLECDECGCQMGHSETPYSSGRKTEKEIELILEEIWNTRANAT